MSEDEMPDSAVALPTPKMLAREAAKETERANRSSQETMVKEFLKSILKSAEEEQAPETVCMLVQMFITVYLEYGLDQVAELSMRLEGFATSSQLISASKSFSEIEKQATAFADGDAVHVRYILLSLGNLLHYRTQKKIIDEMRDIGKQQFF
jgi:hypothetical protein